MERKQVITRPKRGEVYLVSFDPTVGSEIKKTRPALVIQNDVGNRYSPITIVAAITSKFDDELYPTEVPVSPAEGGLLPPGAISRRAQSDPLGRQATAREAPRCAQASDYGACRPALRISVGLLKL